MSTYTFDALYATAYGSTSIKASTTVYAIAATMYATDALYATTNRLSSIATSDYKKSFLRLESFRTEKEKE